MKAGRACVVAFLLLVIVGGAGTGIYFAAIRQPPRGSGDGPENPNSNAAGIPESEETAKPQTEAVDDKDDAIERVNRFYGLSYSPFGLGDNRVCPPYDQVGGMCLLQDQVKADVRLISAATNRIKTYSLRCLNATQVMLDYAVENNMEVMLGVWWQPNKKERELELKRLEKVLDKYGKTGVIKNLMVGNEAVFILNTPVEELAEGMQRSKEAVKERGLDIKVGTAEIYNVWLGVENEAGAVQEVKKGIDMTPVIEQSDWIGLNTHPYFGGVEPTKNDGAVYVRNEGYSVGQHWKKKGYDLPVLITETGFPTDGPARKVEGRDNVVPSLKGLTAFMDQMETVSRENDLPVYFFEPFDGDWKRRWEPFEEHDYNFGLRTCDRKLKKITLPPAGAL